MVLGWYLLGLYIKCVHLVFFKLYVYIDDKYSPTEHGIRVESSIRIEWTLSLEKNGVPILIHYSRMRT